MLELASIEIRRGAKVLARALDWTWLDPGLHLIHGGTGSGKSLLCSVLSGQCCPRKGRVLLDGSSIYGPLGICSRHLFCTSLDELPSLDCCVEDYLHDALGQIGASAQGSEACELLESSFPGLTETPLDEMSHGQRALCTVALAGCLPLRVIVLDAVLDMLDDRAQSCALRLLGRRAAKQDSFVMLASGDHRLMGEAFTSRARLRYVRELEILGFET